tara:strand:- start:58463 stop:58678 length:216 start_codon:yes stop_codon:yes gene_type:complete
MLAAFGVSPAPKGSYTREGHMPLLRYLLLLGMVCFGITSASATPHFKPYRILCDKTPKKPAITTTHPVITP